MHRSSEPTAPSKMMTKANSSPNLTSGNISVDPFFKMKVESWLFKHFQTMDQIKEFSEIQKICDKESCSDLISVCDEYLAKQNTMSSSDKKVNRWLKNNFTTIKEIKVHILKRIEHSLNKKIAKWMNFMPTEETEEFETEYRGLSAKSIEKKDEDAYDGAEEDNCESNSEVNSTILRLMDGLDRLGSASQHGNDINVSSDHSKMSSVSQRSYVTRRTTYSSSDTSDLNLVFYENVEYYSKWLVKKKRNIRDPIILFESKSTAL